ncbi:MAG: hypothetical protein ACP5VQ_08180, partial [Phycisphaerae bacterium]
MKIWQNSLGIAWFISLLMLLVCSGREQHASAAAKNTVVSAVPPQRTLPVRVFNPTMALPRLLAAGARTHLWMMIPVKPLKPGAGPQFLLLSHTINARHGNAGLWKPVSTGTFTGYPVCAFAANNPLAGAMKQGVYLFFYNGDGVCFGRKESLRLPAAGGKFSPVAAAGGDGNIYLLVYGVARTRPAKIFSPAQRILSRLTVLESKMMGTTPPAPILHVAPQTAAKPPSSGKATPAFPPKPAMKTTAASPRNIPKFTSAKIATVRIGAVKVPARSPVQWPSPDWHLLQFRDNDWSVLPPPKLPDTGFNSLVVGRTVMLAIDQRLVVFRLADGSILFGQSMDLRDAQPQWSPLPNISLPHPAKVLLGASLSRHGVLAWITLGHAQRLEIAGLRIGIRGKDRVHFTRWSKPLLSTIAGSGFTDVAMGRDGDCFAILLRQPGGKLTQYTFNQSGQLLQGPEGVIPLS